MTELSGHPEKDERYLVRMLCNADPVIRMVAAGMLCSRDPELVARFFVEEMRNVVYPCLRMAIRELIRQSGPDPLSVAPILLRLFRSGHPLIRRAVISEGSFVLAEAGHVKLLLDALVDRDAAVRADAALAFRLHFSWKEPPRDLVPDAMRAFSSHHPEVMEAVAGWLARAGDPQAFNLAVKALRHPNVTVRCAAVRALSGFVEAIPHLIRALQDKHPSVRKEAIWSLRLIAASHGERTNFILSHLIQATRDRDADVRYEALDAVSGMADHGTLLPILLGAILDPDARVASAATWQLRMMVEGEEAQPVISYLKRIVDSPDIPEHARRVIADIISTATAGR